MVFYGLGVSLEYKPKEGQCQAICCNGGGGELTVQRVCTPTDKCEGIVIDEKKEDGHCYGDDRSTCPNTCDDGELHRIDCLPYYRVTVGDVIVHIS